MNQQPEHNPELEDIIEVCRPGRDLPDDPAMLLLAAHLAGDPELEARYECRCAEDRAISEAMQQAPVPAGLEARVLARLAEGSKPSARRAVSAGARTRRRFLRGLAAGATSAAAAAGILWWVFTPRESLSLSQLAEAGTRKFHEEAGVFGSGTALMPGNPQPPQPFSGELRHDGRILWRESSLLDHPAVAFDILNRSGEQGILYALQCPLDRAPGFPPRVPQSQTSNTCAAVWRETPVTYVLVAAGNVRTYRRFLRPPEPIA